MQAKQKTKASLRQVWQAWEQTYRAKGHPSLSPGMTGKAMEGGKGPTYTVLDVQQGRSFTVSWKAPLAHMVFTYEVDSTKEGTEVRYRCEMKGILGKLLQRVLRKKVEKNLEEALHSFVRQLDGIA